MAGVVLGYLKYRLGFDSLDFNKGTTEAEARLAKMEKTFAKQGQKLASFGKKMSLAISAPLAAFAAASFNTASDAVELQSAFDATFGKMAGAMNKWAEETGNAIGRSTQELQTAAKEFGIFFNTAADPAKSAAMSKQFSMLAEDLASFYNVDVATATEKLRSGLTGESEPLRAFGVFLTEAAVNAKGLELGLGGVTGKLTEQEKILARAAIITEQTKNAQGDLARTSGSTANQMRAASAAFEELRVVVGTKLLPVITPLIQKIAEAISWFTQLPKPVQNVALGLAAFAATIGPILIGLGTLLPLITGLGPVFGVLATGITALIPLVGSLSTVLIPLLSHPAVLAAAAVILGIYLAWKNWDKIVAVVKYVYNGVKTWLSDKLGAVLGWVRDKIQAVADKFKWLWDVVVGHSYVPDLVDGIAAEMARLDAVMVQPVVKAANSAADAFKQLQQDTLQLLNQLFPEAAAKNELARQVGILDEAMRKGILTAEQWFEAVQRARAAADGGAGVGGVPGELDTTTNMDAIKAAADASKALGDFGDDARQTRDQVVQDMASMAEGVAQSFGRLIDSFRHGKIGEGLMGILDVLGQVVGALGKAGVIKVPGLGGSYGGARAAGGPVVAGKTYLVGERGPEFITPNRSGFVHPNGSGPAQRVMIVPSPYFDAVVDRRAASVAAPMAAQAAFAGAAGGHAAVMQSSRRRIPTGS